MNNNLVNEITATQIRKDLAKFSTGDTIKVHVKIKEGDKTRIQVFQGLVIEIRGGGVSKTFTVRKISAGSVGVERTFFFNSPVIAKIEVVKRGKVRRKKIFYIRKRIGKAARIKEKEYKKIIEKDLEERKDEIKQEKEETKSSENEKKDTNEVKTEEKVEEKTEEKVEEKVEEKKED